jgi:uncharacterized protein DUF2252
MAGKPARHSGTAYGCSAMRGGKTISCSASAFTAAMGPGSTPRTRRNGLIAGIIRRSTRPARRRHPPTGAVMTAMTDRSPPRSGRAFGLDVAVGQLTTAERGKAARSALPQEGHAVFDPSADRADPVGLLERQATSRLPDLVPVRYGRMLKSPFNYFRGAALPMAADLGATPVSGLAVQACGDAHLSNFGLYASPNVPWSSTSTTSTRRCPAHGSGTSSGWRPAWRWPDATTDTGLDGAARS